LDEFAWIETYLAPLSGPEGLNLLDDAALYSPNPNQDMVITLDTLVEGVHFHSGEYGAGTAERLLVSNLSDLAAKGARPVGYLLSTAWPKHLSNDALKTWMIGFTKGLETVQKSYDFRLFGGDTVRTEGPMTVSATLIGVLPKGEMVKRSGAKPGDDVWVTGNIGDAYLGLLTTQGDEKILESHPSGDALWIWEEAFRHPKPRLLFRKTLRKYATACADISDGLISEAAHIAKASQCRLFINIDNIPLSGPSEAWCAKEEPTQRRLELATGGDDYELIFTAPEQSAQFIEAASTALNMKITKVGKVQDGEGVIVEDSRQRVLDIQKTGYNHF
jgi:thiamine-monophosphate kinase